MIANKIGKVHEAVLVGEVVQSLNVKKQGSRIIDATVGTGGHAEALGKKGAHVLGIDQDKSMLETAEKRLKKTGIAFNLVQGNFREIDQIAQQEGFEKVDGVLFDLGVSNIHLMSGERGFSFSEPKAPLDMRLSLASQGVAAADLLNVLRDDQLTSLFATTMKFPDARSLARKVVEARMEKKIETVGDFLTICEGVKGKPTLNPATLPFLALRMAVNSELENLKEALPKAFNLLSSGGRIAVISFHSKEHEVVYEFMKRMEKSRLAKMVNKRPIEATAGEILTNRKARSARLNVLEKV